MPRYGPLTFDWRSSIVRSAGNVRAERDGRGAVHSHADLNRLKRVALFVGPEGRLSDPERATLGPRCGVRFGGRVVRAKTAVLLGITLVQHRLEDLA